MILIAEHDAFNLAQFFQELHAPSYTLGSVFIFGINIGYVHLLRTVGTHGVAEILLGLPREEAPHLGVPVVAFAPASLSREPGVAVATRRFHGHGTAPRCLGSATDSTLYSDANFHYHASPTVAGVNLNPESGF